MSYWSRRKNSRRSTMTHSAVQIEGLEDRRPLTSLVAALQIDGEAPEVLGETDGQAILFVEDSGQTQLFVSDGSQDGTTQISTIRGVISRDVDRAVLGTSLYFVASDHNGTELWKTDGTEAGTTQVADLNDDVNGSRPDSLTVFDGHVYFAATTATTGRELHRTDGTEVGTTLVYDGIAGEEGLSPTRLMVFDGRLFFSSTVDFDLYRTDGTAAGTSVVLESNQQARPMFEFSDVGSFAVGEVNGRLVAHRANDSVKELVSFESADDTDPEILYSMFGGPAEIVNRGIGGSLIYYRVIGNRLVFQTEAWYGPAPDIDKPAWNDLYETDGTAAGTQIADQFISRHLFVPVTFTPDAETFPGEVSGDRFFTTLTDRWPNNGGPDWLTYGAPGGAGHITVGEYTYFLDGTGADQTLRQVNSTNDGLIPVPVEISHASGLTEILGELYFTAPSPSNSSNDTALWKLQRDVVNGTGPEITSPVPNAEFSQRQVHVEWNAVPDAVSYEIRVTETGSTQGQELANVRDITSTSQALTLDPGNLMIRLRARFADDSVTEWTEQLITVDVTPPSITSPKGETSAANPWIEWTPVDGAVAYNLWLGEDRLTVGQLYGHTETRVRISELLPHRTPEDPLRDGSTYRVWVQAVFANGATSGWSDNRDFVKIGDSYHPPLVINTTQLQITQTPEITWRRPDIAGTSVVSYEVFISPLGDRRFPVYRQDGITELSHELETELPFGEYEFWVRAHMEDGTVTRWGKASYLVLVVAQFRDPMSFEVTSPSNDPTPELTWTDAGAPYNTQVRSYDVYISLAGSTDAVYRRSNIDGDAVTHEVKQFLNANTTYRVWVRASLADGSVTRWGPSQELVLGDTVAEFDEIQPVIEVDGFDFVWPAVAGADRYELWINEYDASGDLVQARVVHETNIGALSRRIGLPAGTYRIWLRAHDELNMATRWSAALTLTLDT